MCKAFNKRPVNKQGEPSEPDCENVGWLLLWLYKHWHQPSAPMD